MKRQPRIAFLLLSTAGLLCTAGPTGAWSARTWLAAECPRPGETIDHIAPGSQAVQTRSDTLWFGGDDGTGVAIPDGLWDFESPGSNGLQGWTSVDRTENPADYFARVTEDDFLAHGDPCVPIQTGNAGLLWCGVHEDEADQRDFVAGMGYQNRMCQRAFSPPLAIDPATDAIDVSFAYFTNTEPEFDYVWVYIVACDQAGDPIDELLVDDWDGVRGDPLNLALFDPAGPAVPAGTLSPEAVTVRVELRVTSDAAYSDEDGYWDTPCGPLGVDDLTLTVGGQSVTYDFEDGAQGWSFERCPGRGRYLGVHDEGVWGAWIDPSIPCCTLEGRTLGFVDVEQSPYWPPGLMPGQYEQARSGIVARPGRPPVPPRGVVVQYDAYLNLPYFAGAFYRCGWMHYPYTTEVNPVPHWSGYQGDSPVFFMTEPPFCGTRLDRLGSEMGGSFPASWDSLRFVYEIYCSCDGFSLPPSVCTDEGATSGSPLLDNVRLGLFEVLDVPFVTVIDGGLFQDGFGQDEPGMINPFDCGNANIAFDLSRDNPAKNDWLGDSSVVVGEMVFTEESRWLVQVCVHLPRLGPRQHLIPAYVDWKSRLGGDPEQGFVSVLMDSLETQNHTQIWKNKFGTYFHENDPGFAAGLPDYREAQEILPDRVFVPGTRIEYYYRSYWYNGGAPPTEYYQTPTYEFEILPGMEPLGGHAYYVEWPCVLYVDAYNRGAEPVINTMLAQAGLSFDRYDYLDAATNFNASLRRSFGGTTYNPGGYGNNGCTLPQLLAYRLIVFNTGLFGRGALEAADFQLLDEWLDSHQVPPPPYLRRGLVLNGNGMAEIMADPQYGLAIAFAHNTLGATLTAHSYREFNQDEAYCVYLEPSASAVFTPLAPGVSLFGSGCPQMFDFNVLGVQSGILDVVGNLDYYSYGGTGLDPYVEHAQVLRRNTAQPQEANWISVVDGFSYHLLSERGCGGEPCSNDSACVAAGALDAFAPMLAWLEDPSQPFEKWGWVSGDVEEELDPPHLSGAVNFLHAARPNPVHRCATLRFNLARAGRARLEIFDVGGRQVRTLCDGPLAAGEHALTWDATDAAGRRLGAGLYWVRLRTEDGYTSSRRLLTLK